MLQKIQHTQNHIKKKKHKESILCVSTRGRGRTGTSVTSSVFETDASTNSATRALEFAKVEFFLI